MNKKIKIKLKIALVNSIIAGLLVFFGSFTDGVITIQGICAALAACIIIFLTRMRDTIKSLNKQLFIFI